MYAINPDPPFIPPTSNDASLSRGAAYSMRFEEFFDAAVRGDVDRMFLSGGQIDGYGNTNVTAIGPAGRPKVKLGGGGGGCNLSATIGTPDRCGPPGTGPAARWWRPATSSPTWGTAPRWARRAELGFTGGGPQWLVTELGVFDFRDGRARLVQIFPDVSVADVGTRPASRSRWPATCAPSGRRRRPNWPPSARWTRSRSANRSSPAVSSTGPSSGVGQVCRRRTGHDRDQEVRVLTRQHGAGGRVRAAPGRPWSAPRTGRARWAGCCGTTWPTSPARCCRCARRPRSAAGGLRRPAGRPRPGGPRRHRDTRRHRPRHHRAAADKGVRAAVVLSAGFAETGDEARSCRRTRWPRPGPGGCAWSGPTASACRTRTFR